MLPVPEIFTVIVFVAPCVEQLSEPFPDVVRLKVVAVALPSLAPHPAANTSSEPCTWSSEKPAGPPPELPTLVKLKVTVTGVVINVGSTLMEIPAPLAVALWALTVVSSTSRGADDEPNVRKPPADALRVRVDIPSNRGKPLVPKPPSTTTLCSPRVRFTSSIPENAAGFTSVKSRPENEAFRVLLVARNHDIQIVPACPRSRGS